MFLAKKVTFFVNWRKSIAFTFQNLRFYNAKPKEIISQTIAFTPQKLWFVFVFFSPKSCSVLKK